MNPNRFRSSLEDTYEPLHAYEQELLMEPGDAQQITDTLYAAFNTLSCDTAPQYTATTASGYADNKGEETIDLYAEHVRGVTASFRVRFGKQGDSLQYDVPTDAPNSPCTATLVNGSTGEITSKDISVAGVIASLHKEDASYTVPDELEIQKNHLTAANFTDILMPHIDSELALANTYSTSYWHEATLHTHHATPHKYATRTLQLHHSHSDLPNISPSVSLTVTSQPLAEATGEPIEDVNYGVRFASRYDEHDTLQSSVTLFGNSQNPLYSQDDIRQLLVNSSAARSQSSDLLAFFEDAAAELQQSQIPEQSIL